MPKQSLLLMTGTDIECGRPALRYMFELPDLGQYAADHETNYRTYVNWLGIPNAPYMATSRLEGPFLGDGYRSICELGRGGFATVHKAVNTRTVALCAIKKIPDKNNKKYRESIERMRELLQISCIM